MSGYRPKPMDTGDISLPEELLALTEELAKNVHENWAQARLEEGWTYGPSRDGEKKITPCLVPYEELPEEEREYDRRTAMETVRQILKLGYTIRLREE
ncbi:RyR domain-containing protein [Oscillospiraceae bacterium 38-13]